MIKKKANTVQMILVEACDDGEKHLNRMGECETKT